jgi:hypothetical protein
MAASRGRGSSSSSCRLGRRHPSHPSGRLRSVVLSATHGPRQLWHTCRQSEERDDSFHVMCGQLFQHLFIMYPLAESSDDGSIRDTGYSPSYLSEAGDESPESFPGFLPHRMEVSLHAMLLISVGEVRCEPRVELFLGVDRSWGEVPEPGPGWPRQGYMEVCCHYGSLSTCCRNSGDVYLQEFRRI